MTTQRPNIILFVADHWRGDVMGHLGDKAAKTPSLDRLVAEDAVSFRNAFCQNPVCTPSRCSFMSGWYPHVRGHRTMQYMLHPEQGEPNLLKMLKDNGYFVYWGGKNDLVPGQFGFDDYCHVKHRATAEEAKQWGYTLRPSYHGGDQKWRGEPGGDNYYSFYWGKFDTEGEDRYFDEDWAHIMGAIDLVKNHDGAQPFCLFLPLEYPHPPFAVEDPWFSMIDRDALPAPIPRPEDWGPSIRKIIAEKQGLEEWSESRFRELKATYYAMCSRVDHQLGLLVDSLRETNQYDNTALFFFSDHGEYAGDYGLVEKTENTFEDCLVRVPLVVKPPRGLDAVPGVRKQLVELVDVSATVFEMLGIDPGYTHFGKSLVPLLHSTEGDHRDAVFCEGGRLPGEAHAVGPQPPAHVDPTGSLYWPRMSSQVEEEVFYHEKAAMCRTRDYKYVTRLKEKDELYDLNKDPRELRNCIDDPAYAEVLIDMKDRMLRWYLGTGDVVPHQLDARGAPRKKK